LAENSEALCSSGASTPEAAPDEVLRVRVQVTANIEHQTISRVQQHIARQGEEAGQLFWEGLQPWTARLAASQKDPIGQSAIWTCVRCLCSNDAEKLYYELRSLHCINCGHEFLTVDPDAALAASKVPCCLVYAIGEDAPFFATVTAERENGSESNDASFEVVAGQRSSECELQGSGWAGASQHGGWMGGKALPGHDLTRWELVAIAIGFAVTKALEPHQLVRWDAGWHGAH